MDKHSNEIEIVFDESNTKLITKSFLFWLFSIACLGILIAIGILMIIDLINNFYQMRTKTIIMMSLYSIIFIPSIVMFLYSLINVKSIVFHDVETKYKLKSLENDVNNRIVAHLIKSELVNIRLHNHVTSYDYKHTFKTERGKFTYKSSNRSTNESLSTYVFNVEQQLVEQILLELMVEENHFYVWKDKFDNFLNKIDEANKRVSHQQINDRHQSDNHYQQLRQFDFRISNLQIVLFVFLVMSIVEFFNSALKNGFTSVFTKFTIAMICVCLIGLMFQLLKLMFYVYVKNTSEVEAFKITSCEFDGSKLEFNHLKQREIQSVDRFNLILENEQTTLQMKFSGEKAFRLIRKLIVNKKLSKKLVVNIYKYKSNYYVNTSDVRVLIKEFESQLKKE